MSNKEVENNQIIAMFRVNGGEIGLGHLKRCTSLAREFKKRNIPVIFFVNHYNLINYLSNLDIKQCKVIADEREFELQVEKQQGYKIIVLDGYFATSNYIEQLQRASGLNRKIILLDTLKKGDLGADFLINPAPYARDLYNDKKKSIKKYLIGPEFSILDDEYVQEIQVNEEKHGNRILVTMGGADPLNITFNIVKKIVPLLKNHHFKIVIGEFFEQEDLMVYPNVEYIYGIKSLKDLIIQTDYAITAGGTTIFELMRYRIPTIVFAQNESQSYSANYWEYSGILINFGVFEENNMTKYIDRIIEIFNSLNAFPKMEDREVLVNSNGKSKIVEIILNNIKGDSNAYRKS